MGKKRIGSKSDFTSSGDGSATSEVVLSGDSGAISVIVLSDDGGATSVVALSGDGGATSVVALSGDGGATSVVALSGDGGAISVVVTLAVDGGSTSVVPSGDTGTGSVVSISRSVIVGAPELDIKPGSSEALSGSSVVEVELVVSAEEEGVGGKEVSGAAVSVVGEVVIRTSVVEAKVLEVPSVPPSGRMDISSMRPGFVDVSSVDGSVRVEM